MAIPSRDFFFCLENMTNHRMTMNANGKRNLVKA